MFLAIKMSAQILISRSFNTNNLILHQSVRHWYEDISLVYGSGLGNDL
jgi:hypothetical protein